MSNFDDWEPSKGEPFDQDLEQRIEEERESFAPIDTPRVVLTTGVDNPKVQHKEFNKTSLVLWFSVIAAGLGLEAIGLKSDTDTWPPLTQVIVAYLPEGLVVAFIAWLSRHFKEAFAND